MLGNFNYINNKGNSLDSNSYLLNSLWMYFFIILFFLSFNVFAQNLDSNLNVDVKTKKIAKKPLNLNGVDFPLAVKSGNFASSNYHFAQFDMNMGDQLQVKVGGDSYSMLSYGPGLIGNVEFHDDWILLLGFNQATTVGTNANAALYSGLTGSYSSSLGLKYFLYTGSEFSMSIELSNSNSNGIQFSPFSALVSLMSQTVNLASGQINQFSTQYLIESKGCVNLIV